MSPALVLILFLYVPLLTLSLLFLIKAFRRRNKIQAIIFFIALGFCVYRISLELLFELNINRQIHQSGSIFFENLNKGDIATFEGWVSFREYGKKAIQDTIKKLEREKDLLTGESTFQISIPDPNGREWHLKTIVINLIARDTLSKFLNFDQQQKDSTTYRFTIKAIKKKQNEETWKLLHIIRIDTLKELPHYWH